MHLVFLQQLFSDEIMRAICWTLIHSLWQGLLLAIVCGIVITVTRKSSPSLRYNLLSVLFFLFMLVAGFTFNRELKAAGKNDVGIIGASANEYVGANINIQHQDISSFVASGQSYIEKIIFYFNTHASLVVAIWFIIFSARCVRLIADFGYAQRIRHYKTHEPSPNWKSKLQELANNLQIKKHIVFLESEIVKVPMMIGFLKPVVLFPFSLISQLPADQVEAVLLHELAHIKRKDYFVNLVQSFGEIIFFFNPAVIWISSLIREERENCCDDIAIHHTKNKKEFIHALVAFQEYNMEGSGYAIAFPGKRNQLLQRVKRIIQNDNKTLNNMQKIFLASGLIITCLLTAVFAQSKKPFPVKPASSIEKPAAPEKLEKTAPTEIPDVAAVLDAPVPVAPVPDVPVSLQSKDTLPETFQYDESNIRGIFDRTINGKRYEIVVMKNKVTELYIDDKRIADNKISDYQSVIDKIIKEAKEQAAKSKIDAEGARIQAVNAKVQAESAASQAQVAKLGAEDAKRQADKASVEAQQSSMQADVSRKQADESLQQADQSMKQAASAKIQAEESKELAEKDKIISETLIKGIVSELMNDGIIKNDKELTFALDKDEFIVNEIRQSDSIHKKYKKYLRNPNTRLGYSKTPNSTHLYSITK